ncbi:DMT family transporter [Consotaella aegiceratis]|uniref:DMT family transporter n=1 Tax=Consotaella aegiceratis TaxID=3097961 RepID=UPI002F3FB98E
MIDPGAPRPHPAYALVALGTGCLLTLSTYLNSELARHGSAMFSSWMAHGSGAVALTIVFTVLFRGRRSRPVFFGHAPIWAYLGGCAGAVIVILTTLAVNSPIALSGTIALGLAGQVAFSLAADHWGLFGMAVRRPTLRDFAALGLILAGSALIILAGEGGA